MKSSVESVKIQCHSDNNNTPISSILYRVTSGGFTSFVDSIRAHRGSEFGNGHNNPVKQ